MVGLNMHGLGGRKWKANESWSDIVQKIVRPSNYARKMVWTV